MFKLKNIVLSFDEDSGAIIQLTDTRNSSTVEWAYPQNPLGVLVYQTFVPADYETFFSEYFYTSTSYGPPDFGKPGLKNVTKYKVSAKLLTWYRMEVSIFTGSSKGAWLSQNGDDPYLVMNVIALDTAITCIGPANPFPTPVTKPDIGSGFASNIYNNIYGTDYIMWYPYLPEDASLLWRGQHTWPSTIMGPSKNCYLRIYVLVYFYISQI